VAAAPALAEDAHETPAPPKNKWSFAGPFGKYDRAQLQRGFKVYREVCLTCHGMALLSYRNLSEPGGPGSRPSRRRRSRRNTRCKRASTTRGKPIERTAQVADRFPPPLTKFPNVVPPDMSVIAKARGYDRGFPKWVGDIFTQYQEHGVDYIVAMLRGYVDTPAGTTLAARHVLQPVLSPARATAMPPPLTEKRVDYTDGLPTTVEQYSKDVAAFLMWAAEPHLEARKRIGLQVMFFLLVFAGLLYFTKKKVWSSVY